MTLLDIGNKIGRTYRHIQRYRTILVVLVRHGFDDIVQRLEISRYLKIGTIFTREEEEKAARQEGEKKKKLSRPERLRLALQELGPTFIKVGQILSTRPDLIPAEYTTELAKLQDDVPPFDFEEAQRIIEEDFGRPLAEAFLRVDSEPMAAASLAQVHRAWLLDTTEVVVKVRRPKVSETLAVDLEIIGDLARLIEQEEAWELQSPTDVVEEFARILEKEIDFTVEASRIARFREMFAEDEHVAFPRVFNEFTSERVLTMGRIEGIKASKVEEIEAAGHDPKAIAHHGALNVMHQIFTHGYFHADPHPGNIFILEDGKICFLDFGMTGRLSRAQREGLADMLSGIIEHDEIKTSQAMIRLTRHTRLPHVPSMEADVADFMDIHWYRDLEDFSLGDLLRELIELATRHRLQIPSNIFLMIKSLSTIEDVARKLNPRFNIIEEARPVIERLWWKRFEPLRVAQDLHNVASEMARILPDLPRDAREILKQIERGEARIQTEFKGLEPLLFRLNRLGNQLSFALVLAALLVASSIVVLAGVPPQILGIPVIGMIGYILAGIMSVMLLLSLRSGL